LKEEGLLPPELELSERKHIKRETIYEVLAKANPEMLLEILRRDGVLTGDLSSR
jgi:DNA-binding FadR family transcriptional regulator